ncbi:hypothetical protein GCM10008967_28350 [Bacillus carboniphilus]|uniref:Uncharacterized protein n=1 Tax=Bacillus carboniphilus TaxID=86663 RepID=A0ABP3G6A5_9BACI
MNTNHFKEETTDIEMVMDKILAFFFIGAIVCFIPVGIQLFF